MYNNDYIQEYYISRLQISSILFLSQETANTKLAILSFLYSSEFLKTSIDSLVFFKLKQMHKVELREISK